LPEEADESQPEQSPTEKEIELDADMISVLPVGDGEMFALVKQRVGAMRLLVTCADEQERNVRIPGKMRHNMLVKPGDLVVVKTWDFQASKADLKTRFSKQESGLLQRAGKLPQPFQIFDKY